MRGWQRVVLMVALVVPSGLAATACHRSAQVAATAPTAPAAATPAVREVTITLHDGAIMAPRELEPGPAVLRVRNEGTMPHDLTVEGTTMRWSLEGPLSPGGTAHLEVDLEPGTYQLYSSVDDDRSGGLSAQLQVGGGGA